MFKTLQNQIVAIIIIIITAIVYCIVKLCDVIVCILSNLVPGLPKIKEESMEPMTFSNKFMIGLKLKTKINVPHFFCLRPYPPSEWLHHL